MALHYFEVRVEGWNVGIYPIDADQVEPFLAGAAGPAEFSAQIDVLIAALQRVRPIGMKAASQIAHRRIFPTPPKAVLGSKLNRTQNRPDAKLEGLLAAS